MLRKQGTKKLLTYIQKRLHSPVMLKKNAASDRANTTSSRGSQNTQEIKGCLTMAEAKDQK